MQLPFNLQDVRMISIDGDKYRFVLSNGFVEVTIDSLNPNSRPSTSAPSSPTVSRTDAKHIMFDDGIYGI